MFVGRSIMASVGAFLGGSSNEDTHTYIYCVKLPFVCNSSPHSLILPQYNVVKVGRSDDPARRLFEIMKGFRHFGSHQEWFTSLKESDKPVDVFYKGKKEENVIFIQKCCNPSDAEHQIRKIIGYELEQDFQDRFVQTLNQGKQQYIDKVGKTEWVLIRNDKLIWIQRDYRSTWRASEPLTHITYFGTDGGCTLPQSDPNGQEFVNKMDMLCWQHKESPVVNVDHEVEITFPPTNFRFTQPIATRPSVGLSSANHVLY